MFYYVLTVRCPYPGCNNCPCTALVAAETEPPPDTIVRIFCPSHGGPGLPVAIRSFRPIDELPPGAVPIHYPLSPPPPQPRWWQFWKR